MNSEERAAKLFQDAVRTGREAPTEAEIAEAIEDAEQDILQNFLMSIHVDDQKLADSIEKWQERQKLNDQ